MWGKSAKCCRACWLIYERKKVCGYKPTKPERIVSGILERLFYSDWRYVGYGSFVIGGRNPDFRNVAGQNKLIEVFGNYWHKPEQGLERIEYFGKYGYKTLVIWEEDLKNNMDEVVKRIIFFNDKDEAEKDLTA